MKSFFLSMLAGAVLLALPSTAQTYAITPFLTCVDYDGVTNTVTAYFGYESQEQSIVQVMIGSDNRFVPNPAGRGQPVLLFPGLHERAFRVMLDGSSVTQWLFLGMAVTASRDSPRCPTQTQAPPPSLPSGVTSVPYTQQLAAVGGLAARTWNVAGAPPGLSITPDGVLSGIPTAAGTFTVTVTVSDGLSSSQATYRLAIGTGVTISDALSTRPAGFVPQFRTVTQVGVSNTAIATCDTREFIITGGGGCVVPNQNTIQGRVASSQVSGNGWAVTCSGGTATAVAVCSAK